MHYLFCFCLKVQNFLTSIFPTNTNSNKNILITANLVRRREMENEVGGSKDPAIITTTENMRWLADIFADGIGMEIAGAGMVSRGGADRTR